MTWIKTVSYEQAEGKLKRILKRVVAPDGTVDNIMLAHGLRPGSLEGHMAIYKNVLHHSGCTLPKWFREALGVYVSLLNRCAYCVEHHYKGMRRLMKDDPKAEAIRAALEKEAPEDFFEGAQLALMQYAYDLTRQPHEINEDQIKRLRSMGLDDGEILEANQIIAYFAYANRTVLGLGVNTDGDTLGLSPSDGDSENWEHR